ncbi:N-acetylmuramoyl-L-alanine amidase [Robiginitomaculum antarcticum]|uniref:N-acetylmuramoyl-L-alanine amidase n=1 Tax=Robiginitomaculum antarcticum TaxID=437507 RepID=UPI000362BDC6|nr:N-acetylmuramoyl-L-alanine amidase [Robiginitomaculum antarcticum]
MDIISAPSPNFNERKSAVSLLVYHYTGMETGVAALQRLSDQAAQVSAHYLVEEDGRVFALVDEEKRAWHAGVGQWGAITDVNSASIGIEIVNGGHDYGLPDYPDIQIDAVMALSRDILSRHNITPFSIIGHSDLAPDRKYDPGEKFPWARLAQIGIGLWPAATETDQRVLFQPGDRDRGIAVAQRGLAQIGYHLPVNGIFDLRTEQVFTAFQRRFRPDRVDGKLDVETLAVISELNGLLEPLNRK